jgi:hypothetical protein
MISSRAVAPTDIQTRLRAHLPALLLGLPAVGLMLLWAVHDGGYDTETWYWGALATLALLTIAIIGLRPRLSSIPRAGQVALGLFALYVAWSYLSITWAQSPGDALQGSNRALLYLLMFALMLVLPWTRVSALAVLVVFAVGVGAIGVVLMIRLASNHDVSSLIVGSRLASPTGYFNATAALFTMGVLVSTALATRRELPGLLRGLLVSLGCADLELAMIVQSRGWLFTLPLVLVAFILVCDDRLWISAFSVIPLAAILIPLHRLLAVYQNGDNTAALGHAAARAGQASLLICAAAFVLGTVLAWTASLGRRPRLSGRQSRAIGTLLSVFAVGAALAGGTVATHGHPVKFIERQWNGFSTEQKSFSSQSHFGDVGSGRYDFWRVALDAFLAHPIGGLGQDNYADYYVKRRHTYEEPSWTHSLEMRLLAHTGAVGFLLFVGFLIAGLRVAFRVRRSGSPLTRGVAAVALLPLVVWLIHGSIDWFWEMPALSGPALGFLGMAGGLARTGGASSGVAAAAPDDRRLLARVPAVAQPVKVGAGVVALVAAVVALGFPYLSVREVSIASNIGSTNPAQALSDLNRAAQLNPLSAVPGRLGGEIAMQAGEYAVAQQRFRQAIQREPGGWFSWLGAGLAASGLKQTPVAVRDFKVAYSINNRQPADQTALTDARSAHPLTYAQMLKLLVLAP